MMSENCHEIPHCIKAMPGFTPDLYREAVRLTTDMKDRNALPMVCDKVYSAKTLPEVVDVLSRAKIRERAKRITSEVPKFD